MRHLEAVPGGGGPGVHLPAAPPVCRDDTVSQPLGQTPRIVRAAAVDDDDFGARPAKILEPFKQPYDAAGFVQHRDDYGNAVTAHRIPRLMIPDRRRPARP